MDKNVIITILIVIIIAIIGVFIFNNLNGGKLNTEISFLSETNLKNGDKIEFELKDAKGNILAGQNVTISYQEDGQNEDYYVITDGSGKAYLELSDEPAGEHKVTVKYDGNDQYNGCTAEQTITITDGTSESSASTQSNSTASTVKFNNNTNSTAKSSNQTNSSSSKKKTNSSSSNSSYDPTHEYVANLYYDNEIGVYYNDFGMIHGGKYDGQEISDVRQKYKSGN